MRTWGWIFAVLGWLLCVLAGAAAVLTAVDREAAQIILKAGVIRVESLAPWVFWAWGVGLILVPGLALGVGLVRALRRDSVLFAGENGAVLVDISGVEECLRKVLSEEEGVGRARVDVSDGRAEMLCTVTVWLEAASDVVARVRQMQARLVEYYRYVLPDGKPLRVEIKTKLIYQRRNAAGESEPSRGERQQPARGESRGDDYYGGPRYPVDAGDVDPGSMTSS